MACPPVRSESVERAAVRAVRLDVAPRGRSMGPRPARGFTLIEIVIALGLLMLLASIAWPLLAGRITASELPDSGDRIRSMLFMARSGAVMEHRRHRIRFAPGERQPILEYEVDPIREPGEWAEIEAAWAEQDMLLGEVQVHQVQLGRPIWSRPLAETDQPGEEEDEEDASLEDLAMAELAEAMSTFASTMDDEEIDENRPIIVFDVDGSSDWAVLILARIDPDDELEEEEGQLWVLLDGRTGIARLQEQWTEADLSDPDKYVAREKLEPPELEGLDDLTVVDASGSTSLGGGAGGGGSSAFGGDAGGGGTSGGALGGALGTSGGAPPDGGANFGGRGGGGGFRGGPGGGGGGRAGGRGGDGFGRDGGDRGDGGRRPGMGGRRGGGRGDDGFGRGRGGGDGRGGDGSDNRGGGGRRGGDGRGGRRGSEGGPGGQLPDGGDSRPPRDNGNQSGGVREALAKLEELLAADPDLTEAQRNEIVQAFRQMLQGGGSR